MKKAVLNYVVIAALAVVAVFTSCKKDPEETDPDPFELGPLQKILDGYFVRAIAFDSKGNAWIGTLDQGLIRYNENETVLYNSDNSIIPKDFVISDIAIDKNDNVWIGGSVGGMGDYNGGLFKYDGNEFTLYNSQNTPMPIDYVKAIEVDSRNNIWFASCNVLEGGIVKYDGTEWTVYTPDNSALPYNLINSIAIDQSDNVWIALSKNLVKISNNGWKVYSGTELGITPVYPESNIGIIYHINDIKINSKNCVVAAIDYKFFLDIPPHEYPVPNLPVMFVFDGEDEKVTETVGWEYFYLGIEKLTIDHNGNVWCRGFWIPSLLYGVWFGDKNGGTFNCTEFDGFCVFAIEESPDYRIWFGSSDGIYIR